MNNNLNVAELQKLLLGRCTDVQRLQMYRVTYLHSPENVPSVNAEGVISIKRTDIDKTGTQIVYAHDFLSAVKQYAKYFDPSTKPIVSVEYIPREKMYRALISVTRPLSTIPPNEPGSYDILRFVDADDARDALAAATEWCQKYRGPDDVIFDRSVASVSFIIE